MIQGGEVMQIACCADDLIYSGVTELDDLSGFDVNYMVMLPALVCSLKLGDILSELMLYYKVTFEQQFNCIIQSGPAYPVVFILHEDIERLDVKMT